MDFFNYKDGELFAENVALSEIAKAVGTPVYVYSAATFVHHYKVFKQAVSGLDALIAYSVKANSNLAVLSLLAKQGSGADVVSGGELKRALVAGIEPEKIVFSGVGKSKDEMRSALTAGIYQFNVESIPELEALNLVAMDLGKTAPVAIRINPDVGAGGHAKITTGKAQNKFGIDIGRAREVYQKIRNLPGLEVQGVDMHIGSQIDQLSPFAQAIDRLLQLVKALRADGHNIKTFDVGGGLGIPYNSDENAPPLPVAYGNMIRDKLAGQGFKTIFEPGRMIAGNAGVLLGSVQYVKRDGKRNFLILDAAMNDLIRPALYDAYHEIVPVNKHNAAEQNYDFVGPVCETGDTFAKGRHLPALEAGDLVAIRSAGAYGAVQACEYNTRPLVPEVLVSGDRFDIIRPRPNIEDILAREHIPNWIGS